MGDRLGIPGAVDVVLLRGGEGGSVGFTPEEAKLKEERGWVGFTLIFARFEVSRGGQAQGGDGDKFILV